MKNVPKVPPSLQEMIWHLLTVIHRTVIDYDVTTVCLLFLLHDKNVNMKWQYLMVTLRIMGNYGAGCMNNVCRVPPAPHFYTYKNNAGYMKNADLQM